MKPAATATRPPATPSNTVPWGCNRVPPDGNIVSLLITSAYVAGRRPRGDRRDRQPCRAVAASRSGCVRAPAPAVSVQPRGLTGAMPWCSLQSMSSSLVQRNKAVAKRKGTLAAVSVAGAGAVLIAAPVVRILGLAGAGY